MTKLKLLKITLRLGALYFVIGAIAHYFDLTLFPWYDAKLLAPYHDVIIAMSAVFFSMFLFAISKDPVKNIDTLKIVIISAIIASIVSIAVIWKVDFTALGAPDKHLQTIVEGILGFLFSGALIWLYPKREI